MIGLLSALILAAAPTIFALASYKRAQALHEWAKRCDPNNPHFRPPLIWRN